MGLTSGVSWLLFVVFVGFQLWIIKILTAYEIRLRCGRLTERERDQLSTLERRHALFFLLFMGGVFSYFSDLQALFSLESLSLWSKGDGVLENKIPLYELLAFGILGVLSGVLAQIDLFIQVLPDRFTQILLWVGLLIAACVGRDQLEAAFWGVVVAYILGELIYRISFWYYQREAFGRGDLKLMAALGAWLEAPPLLMLILSSSLIGLLFGLLLQLHAKLRARPLPTTIPFGPPLLISGIILYLFK